MIAPGNTIKSSEIKKLAGITLKNQANLYYNSELANAWVIHPETYNLIYSDFSSNLFTSFGTISACVNNFNVFVHPDAKFIYAGEVYDYMEGTTVDTNKWDGVNGSLYQADNNIVGISTATGGDLTMYLTAKALNLKPSSGTKAECIFKVGGHTSGGGATDLSLYLIGSSDGSATIVSVSIPGNSGTNKAYRLVFDNGTCYVYDITSSWSKSPIASFSTSGLSGDWRLKASLHVAYSGWLYTAYLYFYPIVYVKNSTLSGSNYIAETNTVTHTSNIDEVFLTWNDNGSNIPSYVSSNNGTNYITAQKDDFTIIPNPGTQLKLKFDFSGTHTEIPKIYGFACYYDCW